MNNSKAITNYLNSLYIETKCFLNYTNDYELLIAVVLSAQCKDDQVNKATKILFNKYKSLVELKNANGSDIEEIIKFLGLYKNKAEYIKQISKILLEKYNGVVPNTKSELIKLPGVGNKTANVILIELFDKQEFPVDTHINRISKRLGIARDFDNILIVENKLKRYFNKYNYKKLHHQLILFGRNICNSRNPKCQLCKLNNICVYFNSIHH